MPAAKPIAPRRQNRRSSQGCRGCFPGIGPAIAVKLKPMRSKVQALISKTAAGIRVRIPLRKTMSVGQGE